MQNDQLYQKHMRNIYAFFMAKTFNVQVSEDLTSDVFTTAFEQFLLPNSAERITDKEKYLYGIAKHVWLRHLRNKYTNQEFSVENIADFEQYAAKTIEDTKSQSLIDRALPYINQLPSKQRDVLLLRFRDGLSLQEICQQTGSNMNYVKTTQKRGIASLKRVLQGEQV